MDAKIKKGGSFPARVKKKDNLIYVGKPRFGDRQP